MSKPKHNLVVASNTVTVYNFIKANLIELKLISAFYSLNLDYLSIWEVSK